MTWHCLTDIGIDVHALLGQAGRVGVLVCTSAGVVEGLSIEILTTTTRSKDQIGYYPCIV